VAAPWSLVKRNSGQGRDRMNEDKREYKRHAINVVAEVGISREDHSNLHLIDESGVIIGMVNNISMSGMGLFTTSKLKKTDTINVKKMGLSDKLPWNVNGTVVWAKRMGNFYNVGISFEKKVNLNI